MSGGGGSADPWAWLGLLKWSLSYSDGTRDNADISPMSAEDRAFLEKVMKEGIIDENERMKFILEQTTAFIDYCKARAATAESESKSDVPSDPPISEQDLQDLLLELQDIVEQIDFARAFCSLKGLPFLLGCVSSSSSSSSTTASSNESVIPESIRLSCLGILATLCQNNPPVQQELLELGALKTLSEVFFAYSVDGSDNKSNDPQQKQRQKYLSKLMQAISANVRNHPVAEKVFTHLEQAPTLFQSGLDIQGSSSQLQSRTLFFLRALVTSDDSDAHRVETFEPAITYVVDNYLNLTDNPELVESSLGMIEQLLQPPPIGTKDNNSDDNKDKEAEEETKSQPRGIPKCLINRKGTLDKLGRQRVNDLQSLTGDDREFAQVELDLWLSVLKLLSTL